MEVFANDVLTEQTNGAFMKLHWPFTPAFNYALHMTDFQETAAKKAIAYDELLVTVYSCSSSLIDDLLLFFSWQLQSALEALLASCGENTPSLSLIRLVRADLGDSSTPFPC